MMIGLRAPYGEERGWNLSELLADGTPARLGRRQASSLAASLLFLPCERHPMLLGEKVYVRVLPCAMDTDDVEETVLGVGRQAPRADPAEIEGRS
jgi:hypothetical protein